MGKGLTRAPTGMALPIGRGVLILLSGAAVFEADIVPF
jgi:hypothetical protein